jgi:adenosylhomocysteine nucleosidase
MALILLLSAGLLAAAQTPADSPALAANAMQPRIGILIPNNPPDYSIIMDAFSKVATEHFGPFEFRIGEIRNVPVVIVLPPADGPLLRSLAAQSMFEHYNVRAVVYAGTSGAHLGPDQMRIGDIVLGAENVDFGNFFMSKTGDVVGGEFDAPGKPRRFREFYLDPQLLGYLACSASRVAAHTALEPWANPVYKRETPQIFYFGVQGTSTMWLANPEFIAKTHRVFHEIDEDGDWYSNLAATLYHVPFIEVSVISDSILEFPETERGLPKPPEKQQSTGFLAQRISNRVAVDLIGHFGKQILGGNFSTPQDNPFPAAYFTNPTNAQELMKGLDCR